MKAKNKKNEANMKGKTGTKMFLLLKMFKNVVLFYIKVIAMTIYSWQPT